MTSSLVVISGMFRDERYMICNDISVLQARASLLKFLVIASRGEVMIFVVLKKAHDAVIAESSIQKILWTYITMVQILFPEREMACAACQH